MKTTGCPQGGPLDSPVAVGGYLGTACVVQVSALLAPVVPQRRAAPKAEPTLLMAVLVGVHAALLARLQHEVRKAEALARVVGVRTPARQVRRRSAHVLDDGVLVTLHSVHPPIVVDVGDSHAT